MATVVVIGVVVVGLGVRDGGQSVDGSGGRAGPAGSGGSGPTGVPATTRPPGTPLPAVLPTPRQIAWLGPDLAVPKRVVLHAGEGTDEPSRGLVELTLRAAGAAEVAPEVPGDHHDAAVLDVWLGTLDQAAIAEALRRAGVGPPADLTAEGYALAASAGSGSGAGELVLGGVDADGLYYAAQTLKQLVAGHAISGVSVVDQPSLPRRGVVEGFYGSPWTPAERLDQMAFYGDLKLNTYIYAPKADPYHRTSWRDAYPHEQLAQLHAVVEAALAHHVRFTFAISPGLSICFTSAAEVATLERKMGTLYGEGVRNFGLAFDDIDRGGWHCAGDLAYGSRTGGSEAHAQATLLNTLQRGFVADHPGTQPLVMVPTETRASPTAPTAPRCVQSSTRP